MKPTSLSQLKQRASDRFGYILLGCPNFPPATGTTTKTAFEKLIAFINEILERNKSEETKKWLQVCLQEINSSWKNYDNGDISEGRKLIQQAKGHFDDAFSAKRMDARFLGRESGAAFDTENGLAE